MIWSVVPMEMIFPQSDTGASRGKMATLQLQDVTLIVEITGFGQARIDRLISPRASDYLKPEWMPGQVIQLSP